MIFCACMCNWQPEEQIPFTYEEAVTFGIIFFQVCLFFYSAALSNFYRCDFNVLEWRSQNKHILLLLLLLLNRSLVLISY